MVGATSQLSNVCVRNLSSANFEVSIDAFEPPDLPTIVLGMLGILTGNTAGPRVLNVQTVMQ